MWEWLTENAAAVEAAATVLLLVVAVVAAVVAGTQLGESRRLRREQAQPYVVAGMRSSAVAPSVIEVFFRNFGRTAALDVRVTSDPPLTTLSNGEIVPLPLFDTLPTMVPGEEWATWWDTTMDRWGSGQDLSSTVTITYRDSFRTQHSGTYVLDWNAHANREIIQTKGLNEIATAISRLSTSFDRVVTGGAIITQDKEARRRALEDDRDQRRAYLAGLASNDEPQGDGD